MTSTRPFRAAITFGVGVLMLLLPNAAALAANPQCGDAGTDNARFFLGYTVQAVETSYINEADVILAREPAAFCTSEPKDSTYWWVMIAGNGGGGYAQVGINHLENGDDAGFNYFYYYDPPNQPAHGDSFGSPHEGVEHTFRVDRVADSSACTKENGDPIPGGHCLKFYVDDDPCYVKSGITHCPNSTYDPHNTISRTHAWFSSEIFYAGQDVPGTPTTPFPDSAAHFRNINERDGDEYPVHRAWHLDFTCSQSLTWFYHDYDLNKVNQHFYIWTNPVSTPHGNQCSP